MGTKNPDQISPPDWRGGAETVARMHEKAWEVTGRCRACDLVTLVDLRVVIRMKGPAFSLWNRHTRCRRVVFNGRCRGFIDFWFKAPGMTDPKPLAAADREDFGRPNTMGLSRRDVERIKRLAESVTGGDTPAALADLDAPWRVGAHRKSDRAGSGEVFGEWAGCALVAWLRPKPGLSAQEHSEGEKAALAALRHSQTPSTLQAPRSPN